MRTIVVAPTYNEAEGILTLLDAVLREAPKVDVLVVDDSSPDGTGGAVAGHLDFDRRVHLLSRPRKDGLGAAYRTGFGWVLNRPHDVIVQMDADLSHPPDRIPALLATVRRADVAVGSRYVRGGGVRDWSLSRQAISRGGNLYVRLVLGMPLHDATAGFKAFRRHALQRIGPRRRSPTATASRSRPPGAPPASVCASSKSPSPSKTAPEASRRYPAPSSARPCCGCWTGASARSPTATPSPSTGNSMMWRPDAVLGTLTSPEVASFLTVGALGYVVDVASFNVLRSTPGLASIDPSYARILAVALAMVVTYLGNRRFTWRRCSTGHRRREVALFVVCNLVGLGLSVLALVVSHDLLGLTSRFADNISANVIGLALGTLFRYWSYKRFVFASQAQQPPPQPSQRPDHELTSLA